MIDFSFLRLKPTLAEALDLGERPINDMEGTGQVHLKPSETYLQITNSDVSINFNSSLECYLVDECGTELEEITDYIYIFEFTDTNGLGQMAWEFINAFDYSTKPLSIKFVNTVNQETWFTNLFISTDYDIEKTFRLDYKHRGNHYGTQYNRADYYQSIRLSGYFNNKINESQRDEYHQITTDITVSTRNIRKIPQRYVLEECNEFTIERLETALTASLKYIDGVRVHSSNPIEFVEPEGESNIAEHEAIVHKDLNDTFTSDFQIFDGVQEIDFIPFGVYSSGTQLTKYGANYNAPITLNTGEVRVYNAFDDSLLVTFDETVMSVVTGNTFRADAGATAGEFPANGNYYVHMDAGLVSILGVPNEAINDNTTWTFSLQDGDYSNTDYDTNDYLTN